MEQTIRKIQRFKNQINNFNKRCSKLSKDELEIIMARLVDFIQEYESEMEILDMKFKGILVKKYYELRLQGIVPNKLQRFQVNLDGVEFHINFLANYSFAYPVLPNENAITEWANPSSETWQKLISDNQ
jgi:hypothetical protein